MRSVVRVIAVGTLAFALAGCTTTIPAKLQVRDVGSGRTYTTYQPWGKVTKGIGYDFTDIETGNRVTLQNYELSTLEAKKSVGAGSVEEKEFDAAKARGGVK